MSKPNQEEGRAHNRLTGRSPQTYNSSLQPCISGSFKLTWLWNLWLNGSLKAGSLLLLSPVPDNLNHNRRNASGAKCIGH